MNEVKPGFYLSPDGLHIVELVVDKTNPGLLHVIGMVSFYIDNFCEVFECDAHVLFSSWEILK